MRTSLLIAALSLGTAAWAQAPAPQPRAGPADRAEPKVQHIVVEDDAVRVDELRVRGQPQRIVVRSKLPGAPAYEIGSRPEGRDPARDGALQGRALWQLFSF